MSKPTDAPPAYYAGGQGPEAPKPTYDGQQQQQFGGYPPQQGGGYYPPQQDGGYYQQQSMGYGPPGPQGPYGGPQGPYDPNMQGGQYPPGQYPPGAYYQQGGPPYGQYQDNRGQQRGPGMLEGIMAALCCCCCLDILI